MNTRTRMSLRSSKGFTLIEVIAVLVLLGILAAVAVPRYLDVTAEAKVRAIDAAVAELNGQESLAWAKEMISTGGSPADATVFGHVNTNLGADYVWTVAPDEDGGTLSFQSGTATALSRGAADGTSPARWTR